ncbi:MAG: helix-turn-helix domain-containing protein [Oscillospiraceae bacterium]|nr:helix-turn-helix domain-containing protein [Oscillospiraceae bacterium]
MYYTSQDVVSKINDRLKEIGMSKTDFCEKSGVSFSSLSQWNANKRFPSVKSLRRIADCLDMSIEELVSDDELDMSIEKIESDDESTVAFRHEEVEVFDTSQEVKLSESKKELWELINTLDDRQCRRLTNILENIIHLMKEQ